MNGRAFASTRPHHGGVKPSWRVPWREALLIAFLVVIVAAVYMGARFDSYRIAPNVVGLDLQQAQERLEGVGITIELGDELGTVVAQQPAAGERLRSNKSFIISFVDEYGVEHQLEQP